MKPVEKRKEVGIHVAHVAHVAPIARLRARFGWSAPAIPTWAVSAVPLSELPTDISPWDLSAELHERWEERVAIMHYDGRLPWSHAERLALADVLRQAERSADAEPDPAMVEQSAAAIVQPRLFPVENGPYR